MLAHSDDAELSDIDFEIQWTDLAEAIIRLGGSEFKQKCRCLKDVLLDSSIIDLINEVRKEIKPQSLPEGMIVIQDSKLTEWKKCEDLIVDTRACKHGIELVNTKDVVIVTGPPGSGKSTILGHLCLALHRQGYVYIPCRTPDEIIRYYNSYDKQLFLFDDVVGSYVVDVNLLQTWKRYSADLIKLIERKTLKVLVASRSYIYKNRGFLSVEVFNNPDFSATLDLLSESTCLSNQERFCIAGKYMDAEVVDILKEQHLLDKYSFFPLLCKLYGGRQENPKTSIDMFFASPIDMMLQELEGFMNEPDQTVLVVLFIFVTSNNIINVDEMNQNEFKELLSDIVEYFEIHHPLTRQLLATQLDRLTNTYVTMSNSVYSIIHEKIFDILVYFYGKHKLNLLIKHGHKLVIRDRFNIEHSGHDVENITQLDVPLPIDMKRIYFDRLGREILKNSERDVFQNTQWKCTECLSSFIEYLSGRSDIVDYLQSLSNSADSPLFVAIDESLGPLVQFFLQIGFSVNVRDREDATPLYNACLAGNLAYTQTLLSRNAEINQTGPTNRSLLFAAILSGNIDIVRLLLSNGCDVNVCDRQTVSPLLLSVFQNRYDIFCYLLKDKNCHVDILAEGDISVLYAAVFYGQEKFCRTLLQYNCNPNLANKRGETPLYVACLKGHLPIVQLLLDNGSDPNICTRQISSDGSFASYWEKSYHTMECFDLLFEIAYEYILCDPIFVRDWFFQPEDVRIPADMLCLTYNGSTEYWSPLNAASTIGYTELVEILLSHRANPNICSIDGETPLISAIQTLTGNEDIIDILLTNKADPNFINKDKTSALHFASKYGFVVNAKKLIDAGADFTIRNKRSETPLFMAAENGHLDVVKLLLTYTADPNVCDHNHRSPLYAASEKGFVNVVDELLMHNADPNLYTKYGLLPISIAAMKVRDITFFKVFKESEEYCKINNESTEQNKVKFYLNDKQCFEINTDLFRSRSTDNGDNLSLENENETQEAENYAKIVETLLQKTKVSNVLLFSH